MRNPDRSRRQRMVQADWLASLGLEEIQARLPHSGAGGFYKSERGWLEAHCAFDDVRALLAAQSADVQESRAAAVERMHQANAARREQDAAHHAEIENSIEGLRRETPGEVRAATLRAAELYVHGRVPRKLNQCIEIAASEHLVAPNAIRNYAAGVGVRAILDRKRLCGIEWP